MSAASRFASVVFDVDSTLAGIEGIDWLADLRGPGVAEAVKALTRDAMAGLVPLDEVYARRLELIAPGPAEITALADAYIRTVAPGAADLMVRLRESDVDVILVSGGVREAMLPLAQFLGVGEGKVHAVSLQMNDDGRLTSAVSSPLAAAGGKLTVVGGLRLPRPALAVGDGVTDLEMRPAVDAFVAFTGFVRRTPVVRGADAEFADFPSLAAWIFGA